MYHIIILLSIFNFTNRLFALDLLPPCKISDVACIEKSFNHVIPQFFDANPVLGIESSDPLFIEEIIGDLPTLKYKFTNSTFTGGKSIILSNLKVNEDFTSAKYDLTFTNIKLSGIYEISGQLLTFPVEGSGDFIFTADKFIINIDSILEKVKTENGKSQVFIKSFKLKCNPAGPITYDFKNLFNGQKDLAEAVHKFANENYLQVAEMVQDPAWIATMDKIYHHTNQYLKHATLEDFIIN